MAQRAHAILEDPGTIPSIHMVVHSHLCLQSQGFQCLRLTSGAPGVHVMGMQVGKTLI